MHRSPDPPGSPGESDAARLVRECIAGDDRARARLWTEYNALARSMGEPSGANAKTREGAAEKSPKTSGRI